VTNSPVLANDRWTVTLDPAAAPARFFRLQRVR